MFLSTRRTCRHTNGNPTAFRPALESLDQRITPDIGTGAHFLYATSSIDESGALVVDFKEAGLGNIDESVPISITGDAEATYQWFNHGGKKPMGEPFSSTESINVTQSFPVENGQVTGTFTIAAPGPSEEFLTHPHADNWVAMFTVSYTNIVLTSYQGDTQTATTAGEFNLDQSLTTPIEV